MKLSASRCSTLINDILDFSKIEAGKLDLETIDFDLRDTLESTLQTLAVARTAEGPGVELRVRSGRAGHAGQGDPRGSADRVNLVGNAIKFTEQGEVSVTVSVDGARGRRGRACTSPSPTRASAFPPEKQRR